ncbi:hypothetical protein ACXOLH_11165, partial [Streptococcus thermophilus]
TTRFVIKSFTAMFHFPPNDFLLVLYHTSCNRLHYFAEKLVPYNQSETIEKTPLGAFSYPPR